MWPENNFSKFWPLKIIRGHSKTIVTCSTRRKEHAGRWNFALAPSEAKLSAITVFVTFRHLIWPQRSLVDLGPYIYISIFSSRGELHTRFFREALAQSGAKRQGGGRTNPPPPLCRGRMRNGLCRRGLIGPKSREVTSQYSTYIKKFPDDFDFLCTRRLQIDARRGVVAKFHVDAVKNEENISEKPRGVGSDSPPPPPGGGGLRDKSQYARPDPTHPDPARPDPTRHHDAFEKLISLERVDRFTSGLLCSMSPFKKFRIWLTPIPAGACHGT